MNNTKKNRDKIDDRKRDYLVKTFSRTKKKDYENYILNAIWHHLNNFNIEPVSQQYVQRKDGTYALIDLYFPQLNIAVECDESYHKKNKLKDVERQLQIEERLSALNSSQKFDLIRINASCSLENINKQIQNAVEKINKKIDSINPKPNWKIVDPVEESRKNGSISINDDYHFRTINDIAKVFNRTQYPTAGPRPCTFAVSEDAFVWCPKMAIKDNDGKTIKPGNAKWLNFISEDRKYIYEKPTNINNTNRRNDYLNNQNSKVVKCRRYVFGRMKDYLGESYYKFLGAYKYKNYDVKNDYAVLN